MAAAAGHARPPPTAPTSNSDEPSPQPYPVLPLTSDAGGAGPDAGVVVLERSIHPQSGHSGLLRQGGNQAQLGGGDGGGGGRGRGDLNCAHLGGQSGEHGAVALEREAAGKHVLARVLGAVAVGCKVRRGKGGRGIEHGWRRGPAAGRQESCRAARRQETCSYGQRRQGGKEPQHPSTHPPTQPSPAPHPPCPHPYQQPHRRRPQRQRHQSLSRQCRRRICSQTCWQCNPAP